MRPVQHAAFFVPDIFAANKNDISWRYRHPRCQISIMRYHNRTAIIKFKQKPLMTGGTAIIWQVPENRGLHHQPDLLSALLLGLQDLPLGNAYGIAAARCHRRPNWRPEVGLIPGSIGVSRVAGSAASRRLWHTDTSGKYQRKAQGNTCSHI